MFAPVQSLHLVLPSLMHIALNDSNGEKQELHHMLQSLEEVRECIWFAEYELDDVISDIPPIVYGITVFSCNRC